MIWLAGRYLADLMAALWAWVLVTGAGYAAWRLMRWHYTRQGRLQHAQDVVQREVDYVQEMSAALAARKIDVTAITTLPILLQREPSR